MLAPLLAIDVYQFMLVFTRIGAVMMMMPGLSATFVSVQMRLVMALGVSAAILPMVSPTLPPMPADAGRLALVFVGEATIGVLLGVFIQFLVSAVHVAGTAIGFHAGMANALLIDPISQQQSSLVSGFLGTVAMVMIFASGLHMLMFQAAFDSYTLFTPGQIPPAGDMAALLAETLNRTFSVGIRLAAPFIGFALIFHFGMGLLARLIPQMQVYFVSLPLILNIAMGLMAVMIGVIMMTFLEYFGESLRSLMMVG